MVDSLQLRYGGCGDGGDGGGGGGNDGGDDYFPCVIDIGGSTHDPGRVRRDGVGHTSHTYIQTTGRVTQAARSTSSLDPQRHGPS